MPISEIQNGQLVTADPTRSDFAFRLLRPTDREVVKALHDEWFPLSYGESFYDTAVGTEYFSMAAVWRKRNSSHESSTMDLWTRWFLPPRFFRSPTEAIVGMAIMSFDFGIDTEDLRRALKFVVLREVYRQLTYSESQSPRKLDPEETHFYERMTERYFDQLGPNDLDLAKTRATYLLTLGVIEEVRGKGLATALVNLCKDEMLRQERKIMMLHVASYNTAAIDMYRKNGLFVIAHLEDYYHLYNTRYDAYLAVWFSPKWCPIIDTYIQNVARYIAQFEMSQEEEMMDRTT